MSYGRKGRPARRGERYDSGKLKPRHDHGTPEVIAKRMALVGEGTPLRPADPARAYYPLGVALERSIITDEQHEAAMRYRRAFCVAIGRPLRLGVPGMTEGASEELRASLTLDWRAYVDALLRLGRQTKDTVDNLVLYDRWPLWLLSGHIPTPKDNRARERLLKGLDALGTVTPSKPP
ncbi:MAG: hypothetical protein AB7E70_21690 [Hyphomicrobiaceae bacterium]